MSFGTKLSNHPERVQELLRDYRALEALHPECEASLLEWANRKGLVNSVEASLISEALRLNSQRRREPRR